MTLQLRDLRTDFRKAALAVAGRPRLEWVVDSDERDVRLAGRRVQVRVAGTDEPWWDSGTVLSADTWCSYDGPDLPAECTCTWSVTVDLADGRAVSAEAVFETGPGPDRWEQARWVTARRPRAAPPERCMPPYLRRRIEVGPDLRRARLYATAAGIYQPWVNGRPLSPNGFAPGWTDYHHRVPVHAYDVTDLLGVGPATVGAILADGWYSGFVGPFNKRDLWGETAGFRGLMLLEYADRTEWLGTDETWEAGAGEIRGTDLLHGEVIDLRHGRPTWCDPDPGQRWPAAITVEGPGGRLVPAVIDPIEPHQEIEPVSITSPRAGSLLVDLGQNIAGTLSLILDGPAGAMIQIQHAEWLTPDGELFTDNLREARATDTIVLAGDGPRTITPTFTFHGFRYAEIIGPDEVLASAQVRGVALSSVRELTGNLSTDVPLLEKIQHNLRWSLLDNYLEVPMDCPQRDERLGWGGDAQAFAATALVQGGTAPLLDKWTDDMLDAQTADGAFADIAPGGMLAFAIEGAAVYADAGVLVPWDVHEATGDLAILERSFDAGLAWIRYIGARTTGHVWQERRNTDYGDWLGLVETDKSLVSTAYYARVVQVLARGADALGRREAADLHTLHREIREAFRGEFVTPSGSLHEPTQAGCTLALAFDLVSTTERETIGADLVADVTERGHLTTGFSSIGHVLPTLSALRRDDLALAVLLRAEPPSLGHQISRGLTTIAEHWNPWGTDDGAWIDPWMNSLNHFCLGSVGAWMHAAIGGLERTAPGYRSVRVAPRSELGVGAADCHVATPYGRLATSWRRTADRFTLDLEVPVGVRAQVHLPEGDRKEAGRAVGAVLDIGSGRYEFDVAVR